MIDNLDTKSLFVSIVGRPNVGKSSILNMLVSSKISIVSSKPQTTRNRITGILTDENVQLVFIDTPGLHNPFSKLGDYMVSEVNNSFDGVEACMHVVEACKEPTETDLTLIEKFKKFNLKAILAINKIDLIKNKSALMEQIQKFSDLFNYEAVVPVSTITFEGKSEILEEMKKLAEPSVFFFPEDDVTDQTERMLAAEIVREKLLRFLDKELPHGTAVQIEKFSQRNENTIDISALIYCERESHKSMIIGAQGQMIKRIGTDARKSLESIFDTKVNLKLFVKVKDNWRNKASVLHDFGYC